LDRVAAALTEEFELIAPTNERISRKLLLAQLSGERGAYPDLAIFIQHIGAHAAGRDAVWLEYIEQHCEWPH
jgi:hypothetical protein